MQLTTTVLFVRLAQLNAKRQNSLIPALLYGLEGCLF